MAKFITSNSKPGKGISKDAPEKRRFFLFFELFFEKIFRLVKLNVIYFVCLIPLFLGIYYSMATDITFDTISRVLEFPPFYFRPDFPNLPAVILLAVSVFLTGPATAGFTYVLRNLQRREHTWVISDFFEHFRKNFKQGVIMSVLDMVCYTVLYVAFVFYLYIMPEDAPEMGTLFPMLGAIFVAAVTIVYTWAHYYIYTMMVTFKLEFSKLFKNSVIFALAKLPLNLFITAIVLGIVVLLLWSTSLTGIIMGVIVPVIALSLVGFIIVFSTYPTIDKTMLQKVNKRILNTRDRF